MLLIAITFLSCRPEGILHSWELRDLLIDLHKTDALIQVRGLSGTLHEDARAAMYIQVLEKHGVTQAQFDSTLVWYTAHPSFFDKIYPKVLSELQKEEQLYAAAIPVQKIDPLPVTPHTPFSAAQMDSVLWVMTHGLPSSWNPLPEQSNSVHNLENQFFPQIGVLR